MRRISEAIGALRSQSTDYGFESSCHHVNPWASQFTPHCSSSLSGLVNE